MSRKVNRWLPSATDFAAGDYWRGGVGVLMQGSLVLWPLAYRMARRAAARRAMDEQLRRVAAVYGAGREVALSVGEGAEREGAGGAAWPAAA